MALALTAAPASAELLIGYSNDPRDGTGSAARDLAQARSYFDTETGRWEVTVRLHEPATSDQRARVTAILWAEDPARPGQCPNDDVATEIGRVITSTDPAEPQTGKVVSDDRREIALTTTSSAWAGRRALCADVSLSQEGTFYDKTNEPVMLSVASETQPGGPGGPAEPGPGDADPLRIAFAGATRTLRVGSTGRALVRFEPFERGVLLRVRATRRSGGATLARGRRAVPAGRAARVRLRLTRAGRRALRHDPRLAIRLAVTADAPEAPAAARSFRATLRRAARR